MTSYQRWGAHSAPLMLALLGLPGSGHAQIVADTTPLSFLGITAGAPLDQLRDATRLPGGTPLRCLRSRRDPSVQECRGELGNIPDASITLWLSAIDSLAGIITFKHTGGSAQLTRWQEDLQRRYGTVPTRVQGPQRMQQWVRRGRMIRLTWRREAQGLTVSVSLVDGRVLDQWGRRRQGRVPDRPEAESDLH